MKRWLKRSFFVTLLVVILSIGAIGWLISTESGLQWMITQAQTFVPDLEIEQVNGRLIEEITINHLSYQTQDTTVKLNLVNFVWQAESLLDLKLHINKLQLQDVIVQLPPSQEKEESPSSKTEVNIPQLPIEIVLEDILLEQVSIQQGENPPFVIEKFALQAEAKDKIDLQHLALKTQNFNVMAEAKGQFDLSEPHAIDLTLDWSATLPDNLNIAGQGQIGGDLDKLTVTHVTSQPTVVKLDSTIENVLETPNWTAMIDWEALHYPFVEKEKSLVQTGKTKLVAEGDLDNYQFDFTTSVQGQNIPEGQWQIKGKGDKQQVNIDTLHADILKGKLDGNVQAAWQPVLDVTATLNTQNIDLSPFVKEWNEKARVNTQINAQLKDKDFEIEKLLLTLPKQKMEVALKGTGSIADTKNPSFDLTGDWKNVFIPLKGQEDTLKIAKGEMAVKGHLQDYQLTMTTDVAGKQIPKGQWQLQAKGDLQKIDVEKLQGQTLSGEINAKAKANWEKAIQAQLELNTKNLVLTQFWQGWDKRLGLNSQIVAEMKDKDIVVKQLNLAIPKTKTVIKGQATASIKDSKNPTFDTKLDWQNLRFPLTGKMITAQSDKGQVNVKGTPNNYNIQLKTVLTGKDIPKGQWQLQAKGDTQKINVEKLHGQILSGEVNVKAKANWEKAIQAQLELNTKNLVLTQFWQGWDKRLGLNSQIVAEMKDKDIVIKQLNLAIPKTKTVIKGQATASIKDSKNPTFDTKLNWQNLRFPLTGKMITAQSDKGQVHVKGTPEDYDIQLKTALMGKDIPKGNWTLQGQGDTKQFKLAGLQGDILKGGVKLKGQVAWSPIIDWDLALSGQNLNPAAQWKDLKGRLALDIKTQGKMDKKRGLIAHVKVNKVKGKLRGYPLDLKTEANVKGQRYEVKQLKLRSGKNTVEASAVIDKNINATWQINAPNLAQLLPQAKGQIKGKGSVKGQLELPAIVAQLDAKSLKFEDKQLARLKADIDVDLKKGRAEKLDIQASNFQQAGQEVIKKATLVGKGKINRHTLTAKVDAGDQGDIVVELKGAFDQKRQQWQGDLQKLVAKVKEFGQWQLQRPAPLKLSAKQADLKQACLISPDRKAKGTAICTTANWDQKKGSRLQTNINDLPLNLAPLPKNMDITGKLGGQIEASLTANGTLRTDTHLKVTSGVVKTDLDKKKPQIFKHRGGQVDVVVNKKGLVAEVILNVLERSGVNGKVQLPRFTNINQLDKHQPLKGNIQAQFDDLSLLSNFAPDVQNMKGQVNADVQLAGSLKKPEIKGHINVDKVDADIAIAGLEIRSLDVNLHNEGTDKINVHADLESGEGELNLDGHVLLANLPDWQASMTLKGNDLTVINTPDVLATSSPDLKIKASSQAVDVRGRIVIPKAHITPHLVMNSDGTGTGSVVKASDDIVIIDDGKPVEDVKENKPKETNMKITSKVNVILGNDITVDVQGFHSRLGGAILLINKPKQLIPVGDGEIQILEGTFKAYGQDLEIEQGRIMFMGESVTNPYLNIEAVRYINNNSALVDKAGVKIDGNTKNLQLTLFSEPMVEDKEILSYIITGNSLSNGSEDLSVSIGTYLMPKLYVSYGINLFDKESEFNIRYDLSNRWGVEATIGQEDKGVDFSYIIER